MFLYILDLICDYLHNQDLYVLKILCSNTNMFFKYHYNLHNFRTSLNLCKKCYDRISLTNIDLCKICARFHFDPLNHLIVLNRKQRNNKIIH